jgi:hypothetical protein
MATAFYCENLRLEGKDGIRSCPVLGSKDVWLNAFQATAADANREKRFAPHSILSLVFELLTQPSYTYNPR